MFTFEEVPDHNTRSAQIWSLIEPVVEFEGKSVLDIGCGYGDFVWRAWMAGASVVMAVDKDKSIIKKAQDRLADAGFHPPNALISFLIDDLDHWAERGSLYADIVLCLSVLPYLKDFHIGLRSLYGAGEIAVIECQYFEDGPGLAITKNDADMLALLKWAGWEKVDWIGATKVKEDRFTRSIWRCEK